MNVILSGLANLVFVKVMHYDFSKSIWHKIQSSYEGDEKVKRDILQTHKIQFYNLKTNEEQFFFFE